jgi:DNA (cytosine-5)-methyltransferase 1
VAENVAGLVKGTAKGYFLEILARLKRCGYRVSAKVLDAQWLGVPQRRHRLIFVGFRDDLGVDPVHPNPLAHQYTVRDACPWIDKIQAGSFCSEWMSSAHPMATIVQSDGARTHRSQCESAGKIRQFTISELRRISGFPDDFILCGDYQQQWERLGRAVPPVMMMHIASAVVGRLAHVPR